MKSKPDKAKPMSEGTKDLGSQFVQALLQEGHEYDSIKANFLALLANGAMGVANKKLAANPGAVHETTGRMRGAIMEASKMLGITRNHFSKLFHGAEGMAATR
jgi:hypothetical protein